MNQRAKAGSISNASETMNPRGVHNRLQRVCVGAFSFLCLFACDGEYGNSQEELQAAEIHQRFLVDIADQVILPTYQDFYDATEALVIAAENYDAALNASDGELASLRLEVQEKWLTAMTIWQQAEVMQVGPAGPAGMVTGGASMRDEIYSWPSVNSCAIDQQLVSNGFEGENFFDSKLVYFYGLDASEYTLFHTEQSNTCAAPATINASGSWDALDTDSINQRRSAYTLATARHLNLKAEQLLEAWTSEDSNFRGTFVLDPTANNPAYESSLDVLNEVFRAIYFIELSVKDLKLATPLGLNESCNDVACPEAFESKWANKDNLFIEHNLIGLRSMLTGGDDGFGFDDLLENEGYADVSEDILAKTNEAIDFTRELDESGSKLLQEDPDRLIMLHGKTKAITDILKEQFTGILNVQIPIEGAGDTD